jgi:hypothetical protein
VRSEELSTVLRVVVYGDAAFTGQIAKGKRKTPDWSRPAFLKFPNRKGR